MKRKSLILPLLVVLAGCVSADRSFVWEDLRDVFAPTPELTFFDTTGSLLVTSTSPSLSNNLELTGWRVRSGITVTDFEGQGMTTLGWLDTRGVFWLSTALKCAPGGAL